MKTTKTVRGTLLTLMMAVLCVVATNGAAAQSAVGIAPTYDGGGEAWGTLFTQYTTLFMFEELEADRAYAPVLLNPGGVYTPLDTSWLVDYAADRDDVSYLLVTTLKPVVVPNHGKWTILVDVALLDKKTGEQRAAWTVSTEIKGSKTDIPASYVENNPFKLMVKPFGTGRRTFDDSPLGHAGQRIAAEVHDGLNSRLGGAVSGSVHAASGASGSSCPMKVRITYSYKHAASQTYSLLVNGLEESIVTDNGVSSFSAPEGPMLVQFNVSDAPYKLAKQPIYQLSTQHSCSKGMYIVDLDKSGDAHDHWE